MIILIGFIISIALMVVCFISTENIISSAVIGTLSLMYFLLYVNKVMKNKEEKIGKFHECYHFINNFLIALSIKGHISGALASALESQNEKTNELINSLDTADPMEKIRYLKDIYKFDVYSIFLDLINLYCDEGGEIIQMSHYLLNQIRENEEYIVNVERMNKTTLVEFAILWTFSLAIFVVLRFSLNDFFDYIVKVSFYQISVVCILIFTIVSIHIAVKKITNIQLKGWD